MKKLGLLVMPLMAVSLLASCGSKTTWAVKMKVTANENEVISFDCGVKDAFTVNWGDGTTNSEKSHTYAAGTYDIQINNQLETFTYTSENRDSILELEINDLLAIGAYSFENCAKLTTIKFTNNTSLQKTVGYCFRECSQLTSVNLEDCAHLQAIGDETFNSCSSLTSIIIPTNVTIIGESAFGSSGLQTVDFEKESKLEIIDETAFAQCHNLVSIKIPNSIKRIYENAFYECTMLTYNTKDNIKYLGNDSNPYVVAMEVTDKKQSSSYTLDECCRIIYSSLFSDCTNLTSITIPHNVISICQGAFKRCTNLGVINFANDSILEIIDSNAFEKCSALTDIAIPNSVTYIGSSVFQYCSSLANISIPSNVTYFGENALWSCDSISSFYQKENIKYLGNDNDNYVVAMGTIDDQQSSSYTLDINCRIIYDSAFEFCENLTSITIPEKVTSLGKWAFSHCSSLTSIIIPNSVTNIFYLAFENCSSLASVTLSNNLNVLPSRLFSGCSKITSISIPSSITKFENYVFEYCSQLSVVDLTALNAVPKAYKNNKIFEGCSDSLKLYVNHEMLDEFKSATGWNEYANKITDEPVPSL